MFGGNWRCGGSWAPSAGRPRFTPTPTSPWTPCPWITWTPCTNPGPPWPRSRGGPGWCWWGGCPRGWWTGGWCCGWWTGCWWGGSSARLPGAWCCLWSPGWWHHLGSSICPVDRCMCGYLTLFLSNSSWAQSSILRLTASLLCVLSACSAMRIAALSWLATCCLCPGDNKSEKGELPGSSKARSARVLSNSCRTELSSSPLSARCSAANCKASSTFWFLISSIRCCCCRWKRRYLDTLIMMVFIFNGDSQHWFMYFKLHSRSSIFSILTHWLTDSTLRLSLPKKTNMLLDGLLCKDVFSVQA